MQAPSPPIQGQPTQVGMRPELKQAVLPIEPHRQRAGVLGRDRQGQSLEKRKSGRQGQVLRFQGGMHGSVRGGLARHDE